MTTDKYQTLISQLQINPVTEHDCLDLWQWRNDAHTRAMSLSAEAVEYDDHCRWFASVLNKASQYLFIATIVDEDNSQAIKKIGMVRFDLLAEQESSVLDAHQSRNKDTGATALVSINLNPDCRGKGLSVPMLKKALTVLATTLDTNILIKAIIKPNNRASLNCFKAAGFKQITPPLGESNNAHQDCVFTLLLE